MRSGAACLALLGLSALLPPSGEAQTALADPATGDATFNVFVNSIPVGFERTRLLRTDDGWVIRAGGQVTAPVTNDISLFEATYDADWRPVRVAIEGTRDGVPFALDTTIVDGIATSELRQETARETYEIAIDPGAVVLPNLMFAAYEALAVRLSESAVGAELAIFVAPGGTASVRVDNVGSQRIRTLDRVIVATTYNLTIIDPEQDFPAVVWVDEQRRLVRITVPGASIDVARQDLALASTRLTDEAHPGDEDVRVQAAGFSLATTITTPVDTAPASGPNGRMAVVLVPGPEASDRNEIHHGVSIFGQLAGALADRGVVVARYDRRGAGQSGGRAESATLGNYADDAREVVRFLERRDDVNRDRIVVAGHAEGAWIALMAARREDRIKGLIVLAAPSVTGEQLVLEQQEAALDQIGATGAVRQERIDLQTRINQAVLEEGSWEGLPDGLRTQADTPWFRSFLAFDPADTLRRIRQPLLVIHGALDQEVPPHHADRLETIAGERTRREATVEVARLDGLNHLFTPAETGSVEEYASLPETHVAPVVIERIAEWIERLPGRR